MQNKIVIFNNQNIELIRHNNQDYMTLSQIARVLEYANGSSINDILNRNSSEFTEEMTCLIKKGRTRVRIFNREGAWLIGMLSQAPKAPEFRKWVLQVLGAVVDNRFASIPSLTQDRAALKAIGGIVKQCAAVAVREEVAKIMTGAEKEQGWELSDGDILYYLHNWHCTRNKSDILKMQELIRQNEEYKRRLSAIKQAVI